MDVSSQALPSGTNGARRIAAFDRRSFLRIGVGALGAACAASLAGCGFFGGDQDQQPDDGSDSDLPPNAVNFEGLVFTVDTNQAAWTWSQIDNPESSANGALVVGIPVTEQNNDELSRVVNSLYCKVAGPDGEIMPDVSGYYGDDILQNGSIAVGGSVSGVLHFVYGGPGTYTVQFDNLLGGKANLPFEVGSSQASGLRAYPQSKLSQADAETAAYVGTPFDVCGMTLTLSADPGSYVWQQTWNQSDPSWDGQWCVAVPLTIYNGTDVAQSITFDQYALFAPGLERDGDPGGYFQDSHVSFQPAIQPGETRQTWMWWSYYYDGSYYACFDSNGVKSVASVYISWPLV